MSEQKDRWHIIWDMCWEFITDPADCNELSTNIDSFIEAQLPEVKQYQEDRPDREKLVEEIYRICAREIAQLIDEFNLDVLKPRTWEKLPKKRKDVWLYQLDYPDKIIALFPDIEEIRKQGEEKVIRFLREHLTPLGACDARVISRDEYGLLNKDWKVVARMGQALKQKHLKEKSNE